jgi:hypothetical protein
MWSVCACRGPWQYTDDGDLLDKMSPMLQGTVALAANRKWLNHIWFFRDVENIVGGSGTHATRRRPDAHAFN